MAHNVEPMDIDNIESDFDNKENSIHHSNVYPRTPCTEKGYEELDVSELNMKLRYSVTPAASPMSKSYTANCVENRNLESGDDTFNANLTRSLNSAICKAEMNKSVKSLPLQTISAEQFVDNNRNASVLRPLDSTIADNNVTVTITQPIDIDENISFPSSSSSTAQTPEATTPTKGIPRNDGGSPIMRGLKSVLNMFRSSQSPIPPDNMEVAGKQVLSPTDISATTPDSTLVSQAVLASTPIATHKFKESNVSKRSSPHKESLVFNEDLERELLWKDETTILFSEEKIPIHKLFLQPTPNFKKAAKDEGHIAQDNLNSTVEYMDVSYNDSIVKNKMITDLQTDGLNESDGEFVDCETTFTNNKSEIVAPSGNESIDNENANLDISGTTTNKEAHIIIKTSLLQDPIEKELPQPGSPVIIHGCSEDHKISLIEPGSKQIEDEFSLNNELTENKDLTDIANKIFTNVENAISTQVYDTNHGSVDSITTEEKTVQTNKEEEINSTFDSDIKIPLESNISQIDKTFEHTDTAVHDPDLNSNNGAKNLTIVLPSTDTRKEELISLKDSTNSTFVQQDACPAIDTYTCETTYNTNENSTFVMDTRTKLSDVSNPTIYIKGECTFVKEVDSFSTPFNDSITSVEVQTEDETFVKEVVSIPDSLGVCDSTISVKSENITYTNVVENEVNIDAKLEETFVKETGAIEDNKTYTATVGYDAFANEIEKDTAVFEETSNTSTPNNDLNVHNIPANIPLPDEDDIENDKSLGTSVLVEENTIPVESDINNITVTKLQNENITEVVPIMAKSFDVNNAINYPIGEKEILPAINTISNIELAENSDINNITNHKMVPGSKSEEEHEYTLNKITSQNIPMDINETNIEDTQTVNKQITLVNEGLDNNLDVSMADVSNEVHVTKDILISYQDTTATNELNTHSKLIASGHTYTAEIHATDIPINEEIVLSKDYETKILECNNTDARYINDDDIIIKNTINKSEVSELDKKDQVVNETSTSAIAEIKVTEPETNKAEITDKFLIDKTVCHSPTDNLCTDKTEIKLGSGHKNVSITDNDNSNLPINANNKAIDMTSVTKKDVPYNFNVELKKDEIANEEIVLSENNSPFVSVANEFDSIHTESSNIDELQNPFDTKESSNIDELKNPFETKSRVILTPPSSPKIVSKGYNFNFDEIDDPFATKTKIRMSPTPDTLNTTFEEKTDSSYKRDIDKNRRKSQPARKKPGLQKNKLNSTVTGPVKVNKNTAKSSDNTIKRAQESSEDLITKTNAIAKSQLTKQITYDVEYPKTKNAMNETVNIDPELAIPSDVSEESINKHVSKEQKSLDDRDVDTATETITSENKSFQTSITTNETKNTSSSEQSAFYSAGTSSGEGTVERNVFNIPEIDDINFNPFASKSKMRQSPTPVLLKDTEIEPIHITKPDVTLAEVNNLDCETADTKEFVTDEKESDNISNITCSSKATDEKDITVREVHTEDEDTEEGPFFETDDNDKMSDFDGEDVDMMQFSELPPQNNDENIETGEMFIDAEAFEFLLNQNKSNIVSDSGKESLFLKFDPLFAKRVSTDGVLAALNKVQKRQSTPKKMAPSVQMNSTFEKPIAGPSNLNITQEVETNVTVEENPDDLNVTVSKPMMVVTPAVNPVVTPRNRITTPTSSNRRSITFTSPAIAVIDRLLSLSANNSLVGHDTTVTHVSRERNEADLALTQLRELLAEKEINVYNLRTESKELKDRLSSLESQMKSLESESENRLRKINELNDKLSEKTKLNKSMAAVVEEYERTIASLIAETEQDKKRNNEEKIRLIKERDEQTAHLASMEVSFNDLHSKYEKSKQIILTCKANEDSYKKSIKEFEENLTKMQSNYELLKQHATSKLNHANQELEKMNRAHESEILKMNAMIKRKELHITSLEETLAQKTKANEELTAICDELINKVG